MKPFSISASAPTTLGDLVKIDLEPFYSTETATITGGSYAIGTVMAKITAGTVPTTGAAGTNTGGGTCTTVTGGVDVQPGVYTATCFQTATNGGLFQVQSPADKLLGIAVVGTAFTHPEINLTLNDVGTDFAAGDKFTVTVPAGSGKYTALDVDAIDGTYHAAAVLADNVDASSADTSAPLKVRGVVLDADFLVWPAGISAGQKAAALANLAAQGVLVRTIQ